MSLCENLKLVQANSALQSADKGYRLTQVEAEVKRRRRLLASSFFFYQ